MTYISNLYLVFYALPLYPQVVINETSVEIRKYDICYGISHEKQVGQLFNKSVWCILWLQVASTLVYAVTLCWWVFHPSVSAYVWFWWTRHHGNTWREFQEGTAWNSEFKGQMTSFMWPHKTGSGDDRKRSYTHSWGLFFPLSACLQAALSV